MTPRSVLLAFLGLCLVNVRRVRSSPFAETREPPSPTTTPSTNGDIGSINPTRIPPNGTQICPCAGSTAFTGGEPFQRPGWPGSTFDHTQTRNVFIYGMTCACNLGQRGAPIRDDYHYTAGIGSHKLHTRAVTWNEARKLCNEEGGHLAIVNSIAEAHVLMDLFNRSGPVKGASYPDEAFLGIHDLYKEGEWVTVQGDSLGRTGYTRWSDKWGGQPDNGGGRQNCGVLMKEGGLDDVACDVPFAFFCELPTLHFS